MKVALVVLLALIACASITFGAGSHEERVEKTRTELTARKDAILEKIAELDMALKPYNVGSNDFARVRATLTDMMGSRAWRDITARETKTRVNAKLTLEQFLKKADEQISVLRKLRAHIEKAEYETWARNNPNEARLLEIQRRAEDAESAAMDAQWQAQQAKSEAERALNDAQQAQQQALEAEQRARNAQQRSRRAEDALWQNGILSW